MFITNLPFKARPFKQIRSPQHLVMRLLNFREAQEEEIRSWLEKAGEIKGLRLNRDKAAKCMDVAARAQ